MQRGSFLNYQIREIKNIAAFQLVGLIIRFLIELVSNKKNIMNTNDADVITRRVFNPAEFALR